ncbi:unnamed protein product [Menidia menidia]|uniref:(Atlantic silverside) hypothetical protein n=1 Tax=Menidia menidia TaxID=238744 RepID=A0A8S4A8F2_9TELE|nr:unnamed protein product [Menidia menidia]
MELCGPGGFGEQELGRPTERCLPAKGVMCEAELSFTLEPSDIIAVQEQPLMLHCQVHGIPPIATHWRHNGLLLTQDQHHTTFINGSLLIGHFQKTKSDGSSDEGDYECMAQNSFGRVHLCELTAGVWCWTDIPLPV